MMVQVVSEYDINPNEVIADFPEWWEEFKRWHGEDKGEFVIQVMVHNFEHVIAGRDADYMQVDYV